MKLTLTLLVLTVLTSHIYCNEDPETKHSQAQKKGPANQDNKEPVNTEQVTRGGKHRKEGPPRTFIQNNYGSPDNLDSNATQQNYGILVQSNHLPANKTQNGGQVNHRVLFQENFEPKNRTVTHKRKSSNHKDKKRQPNRKHHKNNNRNKSRHNKKNPQNQNKTLEVTEPGHNKRAKGRQRNAGVVFRSNYRKMRKEIESS